MLRFAMMLPFAAISTAQAQERAVIGPAGFSCGRWTNTLKAAPALHERRHRLLARRLVAVRRALDLPRRGRSRFRAARGCRIANGEEREGAGNPIFANASAGI